MPSTPGSEKDGAFQPKLQIGVCSANALTSSRICHGTALTCCLSSVHGYLVHMAKQTVFCNRAAAAEAHDDIPRSPDSGETIGDIIVKRYSRRDIMRGTLGVAASAALFGPAALAAGSAKAEAAADRFDFEELRGRHRREPSCRARLSRPGAAQMGRPALSRFTGLQSDGAERRRAIEAVRLQQRLRRLLPARWQRQARAPLRQSRIHQRRGDVPRHQQAPGHLRLRGHDGRARRHRDGGAWGEHRRDRARGRGLARRARQPL